MIKLKRASSSYIDDILVAEKRIPSEAVVNHLKRNGLTAKSLELL